MAPFDRYFRQLQRTDSFFRAGYATQRPQGRIPRPKGSSIKTNRPPLRAPLSRRPVLSPQRSRKQKDTRSTPSATNEGKVSVDSISCALRKSSPENNDLLSPIHIPSDPHGVLNESHAAYSILANSSIVVTRQLEMMNVLLGFEQANRYVIMDPQGNEIGYMAEKDLGMGNMMARQMFSTHRSFTTHVFDKGGKEVLRFHRPFAWISSRIGVYDPLDAGNSSFSSSLDLAKPTPGALSTNVGPGTAQISQAPLSEMRIIGEAQQQWAPLRRKYNLFLHRPLDISEAVSTTPQLTAGKLPLSDAKELQITSSRDDGQFGQFAYVDEPFLSWDFSLLSDDQRLIGSVNRNFAGFGREIFTDTGVYALRMDAASLAQEPGHLISKSGQKSPANTRGMTLDQRAVMLATAVSVDFDYFSRKSRGITGGGFMPLWVPWGGGTTGEAGAQGGVATDAEGGDVPGETGGAVGNNGNVEGEMVEPEEWQSPWETPGQGGASEDFWDSGNDARGSGGSPPSDGGGTGGDDGGLFDDFF